MDVDKIVSETYAVQQGADPRLVKLAGYLAFKHKDQEWEDGWNPILSKEIDRLVSDRPFRGKDMTLSWVVIGESLRENLLDAMEAELAELVEEHQKELDKLDESKS